jgi:hypothetical protein
VSADPEPLSFPLKHRLVFPSLPRSYCADSGARKPLKL